MSVHHLNYITAMARTGSITAASRLCGVSQPTLSRYLDSLERDLGVPLFVRSHRRLTLTPAGEIYVEAAEHVQQILQQTFSSIKSATGRHPKKIVFGATPFRGSTMIAAAFKGFFALFPDTQIEIREGYATECIRMLREGEIDLGLAGIPDPDTVIPGIRWISLQRSEVLAEVPLFHPAARRALEHPEIPQTVGFDELVSTPLILPGKETIARSSLDGLFRRIGFVPVVAYETPNINLLHQLAQDGLGISFLPAHNVHRRRTDTSMILQTDPPTYIYNGLGFHENHQLTDAEKVLIVIIMSNRQEMPGVVIRDNELTLSIQREVEERSLWTPESLNIL